MHSLSQPSFPEILSVQVSRLVRMMREEATGGDTRIQLQKKVAALSQSQLARAKGVLAMISDGLTGSLDLPMLEPKYTSPKSTRFPNLQRVIYCQSSKWQRMQLALLKSIRTGAFADAQYYAYSALGDGKLLDLRPVFTSSIMIEEWALAITTRGLKGS